MNFLDFRLFSTTKVEPVLIEIDLFPVCVTLLQLEERVFDDSLDLGGPAEHSERAVELRPRISGGHGSRSIRRQTWNRDDVSLFL